MVSSSPSVRSRHSTRSPFTQVPFRLRSSRTRTRPSCRQMRAWRRETVGSSRRMSAVRLRPIRVHSRRQRQNRHALAVTEGQELVTLVEPSRIASSQAGSSSSWRDAWAGSATSNSDARAKRCSPQFGHSGNSSSACSATWKPQVRQRNEPTPARVPVRYVCNQSSLGSRQRRIRALLPACHLVFPAETSCGF